MSDPPMNERHILIVDDEELYRELLGGRLGRQGYRISEAGDGEGALRCIEAGGGELARLTNIFADSIGDIMSTMVNNGYSRTLEYQADKTAVTILTRTGYNPAGLPDMLAEMQKRLTPGGADFAKTHPAPQDRISELASLARVAEITEPPARVARFKAALGNI